jgi:hypothetical protein
VVYIFACFRCCKEYRFETRVWGVLCNSCSRETGIRHICDLKRTEEQNEEKQSNASGAVPDAGTGNGLLPFHARH